jgi:UDP-glucose 4-epimerase
VYGDYEESTRLIPSIGVAALQRKTIELSGGGYVRDFIYIDDVIDLYLTLAEQRPPIHYIFNAGSGTQSTVGSVVECIQNICGYELDVAWGRKDPRPWEPESWVASCSRSEEVLGWHARYTLQEGLEKSLRWFSTHLEDYQGSLDKEQCYEQNGL